MIPNRAPHHICKLGKYCEIKTYVTICFVAATDNCNFLVLNQLSYEEELVFLVLKKIYLIYSYDKATANVDQ